MFATVTFDEVTKDGAHFHIMYEEVPFQKRFGEIFKRGTSDIAVVEVDSAGSAMTCG